MIVLKKMADSEFDAFLQRSIPSYAEEKMRGEGLNTEDAMKVAKDSFASLLPQGLHSENQFLFSLYEKTEDLPIGTFWFARRKNGSKEYAYIYEIFLFPEFRGKGYGSQAMKLAEAEVKKIGLHSIGLHVFGHNDVAIRLYEKIGYRTTNRIMTKDL